MTALESFYKCKWVVNVISLLFHLVLSAKIIKMDSLKTLFKLSIFVPRFFFKNSYLHSTEKLSVKLVMVPFALMVR